MSKPDSPAADDEEYVINDDAIVGPDADGELPLIDQWTDEVFRELDQLQNKRWSWGHSFFILVLTLGLFGAAQLVQKSAENLGWLVAVLLIHELGHFVGMKLFGYRDVKMFFLPFFGAGVSGRSHNVSGGQTAIVTLLGPLPGIAIGVVLGIAALVFHNESLRSTALLFTALNGFNLLPFMPLDGGRLLQQVLFGRQRHLEALFQATTGVLLAGLGFTGGEWFLGGVGIMMLIGSGHVFRISTVAGQKLAELGDGWKPSGEFEQIPSAMALCILQGVRSRFPQHLSPKMAASLVRQIWDRMHVNPPGVAAALALLSVYAVSCIVALVGSAALVLAGPKPAPLGQPETKSAAAPTAQTESTAEQVCQIVAQQLQVDRSKMDLNTSLFHLHADELDFVELVMELEDHFQISIPDDAARALLGTENWAEGAKNVTVGKLAGIVNERLQQRTAGVDQKQAPNSAEKPAPN